MRMPPERDTRGARDRESGRGAALAGPGRLGQALGRLLVQAGVEIEWIAARRPSAARAAARFIGAGHPVTLHSPELSHARALLLTTSDSALPTVARSMAGQRPSWHGCVVLHTSGAWPAGGTASVLEPFRRRGAAAASLHPLQTVPSRKAGVQNLTGCYWTIEGDPEAVRLARRWVRALRGTALTIAPQQKAAYHAAAVMACAGVVTLMESAERLMTSCGIAPVQARKMLAGFVAETAKNFGRLGGPRSLTGPAVRRDWKTIRKHQAALRRQAPDLLPLYRELLRLMLKL
ncbi:MAG TPA: Rossmann-like and DUF2520 domain-containing protein [Terriglobia bacterium]|nr:Rossmann-like and DUF2520 domain-containing protein [Terriglobia bacterium]